MEVDEAEVYGRAKKYFEVEKGPTRLIKKTMLSNEAVFCFENGICICHSNTIEPKGALLEKDEKYTIIKLSKSL
ncbi:hypothetical protein GINT2_001422 [Glugoides intestinalis]